MSDPTPLIKPERTGSEAAQRAVDALVDLLIVLHDGEDWGRTIVGRKNALAEALDAIAPGPSGE